jgi:two-component system chemotaxis response regulator CheY
LDKKILVIDDSATVRLQVRTALAGNGFEIIEASDGVEGLEAIANCEQLAAVICDVNMPRMDGLQMLRLVKSQKHLLALPVLMLTTEAQSALVKQAKESGARGWLVKPFNAAQLLSTMHRLTAS